MNRALVLVAAVLVGLGINLYFDRDNVYDMATNGLWALALIFARVRF
jgi:hypothetical protein